MVFIDETEFCFQDEHSVDQNEYTVHIVHTVHPVHIAHTVNTVNTVQAVHTAHCAYRAFRRAYRQGWAEDGHFNASMNMQKLVLNWPCFGGWVGMREHIMLASGL